MARQRIRGPSGLGRAFDEEEAFSFLLGVWTKCSSSNVAEARYLDETMTLEVGFDGGDPAGGIDYYAYPGVTFNEAQSFALSDSKGTWIFRNLKLTGRAHYAILKTRSPKTPGRRKRQP